MAIISTNVENIPKLLLPGLESLLKQNIEAAVTKIAESIVKDIAEDIFNRVKYNLYSVHDYKDLGCEIKMHFEFKGYDVKDNQNEQTVRTREAKR